MLVVAAAWGLWFQLTLSRKHIPDADYQRVAEVIAREAHPGDAVLLYPWWTERARLFLPENLPTVGYLGSDRADLDEHPRIWLLAAPELPGSDLQGFLRGFGQGRTPLPIDGDTVVSAERFGKLRLALYRNDRARPVLWSAVDHLPDTRVYLEHPNGQREPCEFDGRAFVCPGRLRVAAEWHEIFYQPRRCLFLHAPGGGDRLVAAFTAIPPAPTLRLSSGIVWEHAWKHDPGLTPYNVSVRAPDGAALGSLQIPPGREGLEHLDLPFGGSGPRTVEVSVQSDRFEERDGCVELTALGARP